MDDREIPVYRYAMFPVILSPPASPPWSPASLPGLVAAPNVALARSLGYLWQDSGETIPAVADTDPVYSMWDAYVPSIKWRAPSNSARPTLRSGSGKWYLDFDGVDDTLLATPTVMAGDFSVAFAGSVSSVVGNKSLLTNSDAGAGNLCCACHDHVLACFRAGAAISDTVPEVTVSANELHRAYWSAASGSLVIDFLKNNTTAATITVAARRSTGGGRISGGVGVPPSADYFVGKLYGMAIYDSVLSAANRALLDTYLLGLMP